MMTNDQTTESAIRLMTQKAVFKPDDDRLESDNASLIKTSSASVVSEEKLTIREESPENQTSEKHHAATLETNEDTRHLGLWQQWENPKESPNEMANHQALKTR